MNAWKLYKYVIYCYLLTLNVSDVTAGENTKKIGSLDLIEVKSGKYDSGIAVWVDGTTIESSKAILDVESFYILTGEVSQNQWDEFSLIDYKTLLLARADNSLLERSIPFNKDFPAVDVGYENVIKFCNSVTKIARENNLIATDEVVRLPTLLEWYYLMDVLDAPKVRTDKESYNENSSISDGKSLSPVNEGSEGKINGIFGNGNAFEWCFDSCPKNEQSFDIALKRHGYVPWGSPLSYVIDANINKREFGVIVGRDLWDNQKRDLGRAQMIGDVEACGIGFRLVVAKKLK